MDNLKTLRQQNSLSQQRLADILHISQQSVYKYENGITTPDIETLLNMADYFNTSVDYLIGYTDIPHKIEPVSEYALNADEQAFLKKYRQLPASNRNLIQRTIDELLNNIHLK